MPAAFADLFDTPLLPGLASADDFLSETEERALIAHIDAQTLEPFRFQGWLGKRLTTSFGWSYDFDRGAFDQADPIPEWLKPVKARAAAFAGLSDDDLVQALLIRYDPGAGIGWHRDRPVFEHVVGISLGVPATMRFRQRRGAGFERVSAPLAPRSVYHLGGEARREWEHSIAEMEVTRWSITFRSFSERGLRARDSQETSMATTSTDALIVACPHCASLNRVPRGRIGAGTCGRCKNALFAAKPITITAANFDAHASRSDLPLLVDFWASWCGPCRQMAPAFEAAARQLEPWVRLGKLDTEAEQAIAGRYAIRSIPTMILFRKGREVARQSGAMPERAIVDWARSAN